MDREQLAAAAKNMLDSGEATCWADVAEYYQSEINTLALSISKSPAFVMACTIDDVEQLL